MYPIHDFPFSVGITSVVESILQRELKLPYDVSRFTSISWCRVSCRSYDRNTSYCYKSPINLWQLDKIVPCIGSIYPPSQELQRIIGVVYDLGSGWRDDVPSCPNFICFHGSWTSERTRAPSGIRSGRESLVRLDPSLHFPNLLTKTDIEQRPLSLRFRYPSVDVLRVMFSLF